jgi:hypothetical protein
MSKNSQTSCGFTIQTPVALSIRIQNEGYPFSLDHYVSSDRSWLPYNDRNARALQRFYVRKNNGNDFTSEQRERFMELVDYH